MPKFEQAHVDAIAAALNREFRKLYKEWKSAELGKANLYYWRTRIFELRVVADTLINMFESDNPRFTVHDRDGFLKQCFAQEEK
jgi:hypothetical protein